MLPTTCDPAVRAGISWVAAPVALIHKLPRPRVSRWAAIGAASAGLVGGIVGLILGLTAYPPTAWFAIFELGIPATILGGLLGATGGAISYATRRQDANTGVSNSGSNHSP